MQDKVKKSTSFPAEKAGENGVPYVNISTMNPKPSPVFFFLCFFSLSSVQGLRSDDWPNWRGPAHQGSRDGENYPTEWSAEDVLWKVPLPGKGASSPVVWNDRIFVTSPDEGIDTVIALDLDGKTIWQTKLG